MQFPLTAIFSVGKTNMAATMQLENKYSRFSRTLSTAMLMYRTVARKRSLGNLVTWATCFHCFVQQHGPSHQMNENQELSILKWVQNVLRSPFIFNKTNLEITKTNLEITRSKFCTGISLSSGECFQPRPLARGLGHHFYFRHFIALLHN